MIVINLNNLNTHKHTQKCRSFHDSRQVNSHQAMVDATKVKRSIYFATLQWYVIFETELYNKVAALVTLVCYCLVHTV